MANTTTDKLRQLQNTKIKIKNAIASQGIDMPTATTFNDYSDFIEQIGTAAPTSSTRDLMMLADYYENLMHGEYVHDNYTDEDDMRVENLVNLIVEGEV